MSIHSLSANEVTDPVTQARIDLAAALRLAVLHELEEGIDNHFTVTVPGHEDRYLTLPFGLHWSEARASNLIVFDESGQTLEGTGFVELSAHCIHTPIHRITGARVVMHTHQTWALALNMLKNNRFQRVKLPSLCVIVLLTTITMLALLFPWWRVSAWRV